MKTRILFCCLAAALSLTACAQENISDLKTFEKISYEDIDENSITMVRDWMLVGAGEAGDFNMMTASWGNFGWLWGRPVSIIYVRPQRHTHNYTEKYEYYTLCFFDDSYKDVLLEMGTVSGRNFDKMNYDKLTPVETENGSIAFKEATLIIECRVLHKTELKEEDFTDPSIATSIYHEKDFHTIYTGEIMNVWRKK